MNNLSFGKTEEKMYYETLSILRNNLQNYLKTLDDAIFKYAKKEWKVVRKDERTLTTSGGKIKFSRRYYINKKNGNYCYLLDEIIGIGSRYKASPFLQKMMLSMSLESPYRDVSDFLNKYHNTEMSHSQVQQKIIREGTYVDKEESLEQKNVYGLGKTPTKNGSKISKELFIEADGTFVPLQGKDRKKKRRVELKMGYVYDSRKLVNKDKEHPRYKLENKQYYSGINRADDFWERLGIKANEHWDMKETEFFAIGGDGAHWVKDGQSYFPNSIFQLDKFHFKQSVLRTFGIINKDKDIFLSWLDGPPEFDDAVRIFERVKEKYKEDEKLLKKITKLETYLLSNLAYIEDYRKRLNKPELPPLGTCEGNINKVLTNRFKKRGMSWSLQGADSLCKVLIACRNNEKFRTNSRHKNKENDVLKSIEIKVSKIIKQKEEKYIFDQGSIPELKLNRSELRDEIRRLVN